MYGCPCGRTRLLEPRPVFSLVARCPKCSGTQLRIRRQRDGVDRILKNPFRLLQMILGGNLYHCEFCRIQFYDVRPPRADSKPAAAAMVERGSRSQ